MALTGTVKELSLPNLIQLHCTEGQSARLHLTSGRREGVIYLAAGQVVHAEARGMRGEEAFYELLGWDSAAFRVELNPAPPALTTISTPWNSLLLEGLRRLDEAQAERSAQASAALQAVLGQRGLRAALVVSESGALKADTTDEHSAKDAALIAFIGARAQAIGAALDIGACEHVLCARQVEKVWIERVDTNYLGCWLEARASPELLKELREAIRRASNGGGHI